MFTGLIEATGRVALREAIPDGVRFKFEAPFAAELVLGESVAVDGACLTVSAFDGVEFEAVAIPETLELTSLKDFQVGRRVNLERALRLGDRLGGHLVQGHVDGVGAVLSIDQDESGWRVWVESPALLRSLISKKGSITINGVSLTVSDLKSEAFEVSLVPHTLEQTTFSELKEGDSVNLEVDLLARYLQQLTSR